MSGWFWQLSVQVHGLYLVCFSDGWVFLRGGIAIGERLTLGALSSTKTAPCISRSSGKLGRVAGAMAMGFSTQSGFLYSCSSSFWFTSSCRRSTPTAPASHAFSTFSKAFHSRITEETETHPLSFHRQFGVHMEMSMPSTPPWTEPYPYQHKPEKKLLTGKSVILQQNNEKKCFHGPPAPLETRDCMTTPEMRPSNTDNCTARKRWLIEAQKCKTEVRNGKNGMGIPKQSVEDGISYKIGSLDSLGIASSDNIDRTEALENLWNMDYTLWNQKAHKVQSKSSADEETFPRKVEGDAAKCSPSVSEGSLLYSKASKELGIKDHGPLDNVPAMYNSVSSWMDRPKEVIQSNGSLPLKLIEKCKERPSKTVGDRITNVTEMGIDSGKSVNIGNDSSETYIEPLITKEEHGIHQQELREKLRQIYDKVLVVDNISVAKRVVKMLTTQYRDLVHACDTEVANIDVKQETPVDHGEIVCFSIYSGPEVEFGNGKNCIWVDVLDGGGQDMLTEFAPFFGDPSIRKVWHNYSFDSHVIENYGIKLSGFHADTMHMARLWDSSRRTEGGYSLEALTSDPKVCKSHLCKKGDLIGKVSMKTIFGRRKIKKDGSEGKLVTIAPVEKLQKEERIPWICYSALDSINTLQLYESLKIKLTSMKWILDGKSKGSMYDFYEKYWRPFGELLVKMEAEGMLVDRAYLAEVENVAREEQQIAANRFRGWASRYCPDAIDMNVGSDAQLRQLFFGGTTNRKDPNECLPTSRTFKVPNIDKVIEKGKKVPSKYRNITLKKLGSGMQTEMYTASGWPAVSIEALKMLAGKVSADFDFTHDADGFQSDGNDENPSTLVVDGKQQSCMTDNADMSAYGTAYAAFGGDRQGKEACHAIAALCEICAIDSLISNFIIPLQENHISGKNGRIHCSLNINTETGRLSARRPNLQNQPALEKDRYKIRQAFIAAPGNSLIVADYGQLELRILAHLANCKSMLDAFKAGGDFHSRTALNMYPHIREAVEQKKVLLEWYPQPGEEKPPVPLLKDAFASERRKAKMLNFSIAYGKTPVGLSRDWKVSVKEAKKTVDLWYKERREVLHWQEERKQEALKDQRVHTLLGRARSFPLLYGASNAQRNHIERAAINTPVQGSAADVAMCAMLEISRNVRLKELGWRLLLQVHDEVILEGPTESAELAKGIVVDCMSKPFWGTNFLKVDLSVDAKCALNWYAAK